MKNYQTVGFLGEHAKMVGVTRFERARSFTSPASKAGPLPDYGPTLRIILKLKFGRCDRDRTCDLMLPKHAHYQTVLHTD